MLNKSFFIIVFLAIIIQVIFSFYYSSEIINQNNLIENNQVVLQSLKVENQELAKKFTSLTSIKQIETLVSQKNYIDLKDSLNLQN